MAVLHAKFHDENSEHDEIGEVIRLTGRTNHNFPGLEILFQNFQILIKMIDDKKVLVIQIENEYQNVEKAFGDKGPSYVRWAAAMAVGLQTGVPWVMCKQDDAPDPVVRLRPTKNQNLLGLSGPITKNRTNVDVVQINSCNGMMCGETFVGPNSPNKPAMWTEDWTHL